MGEDAVDAGARWAFGEPVFEVGKGVGATFGPGFDVPVVEVPDPAGQAEGMGLVGGGIAEADALDAALDDGVEGGSSALSGGLLVHGTPLAV